MKNPKIVIAIALALGLISAGMVYRYAARLDEKAPEPVTTTVVVASRAIPPRSRVERDALRVMEVPIEHDHPDSLRNVSTRETISSVDSTLATSSALIPQLSASIFWV